MKSFRFLNTECDADLPVSSKPECSETAHGISSTHHEHCISQHLSNTQESLEPTILNPTSTALCKEKSSFSPPSGNSTMQQNDFDLIADFMNASGKDDNLDTVKKCVINGVNVETQFSSAFRAIHLASYHRNLDVIKYLVEELHVDVAAKSSNGWTPLHLASERGHLDIVQYFVQDCHIDTSIKDNDGWTALHLASGQGHLEVVRCLVQDGRVDVTARDNDGWTALHLASGKGHLDIVQFFVQDCRVDATTKSNEGWTGMHLASQNGHLDVVRYFIQDCHVGTKSENLNKDLNITKDRCICNKC